MAINTPQSRYDKANRVQISIMLNKKYEQDLVDWMQKIDNKQGYIKHLIREDMEGRHREREQR